MKVLVAEDDAVSRRLLEVLLQRWGYEVVTCNDGQHAWQELQEADPPRLLVLDWMMPGIDGLELCRRLRRQHDEDYFYIVILTAREELADIVTGLDAGADDYITKPFDQSELRSRLRAGERILRLKDELAGKVRELEQALEHVKQLQGIIPICMHCHRIRDEKQIWHRLEQYLHDHSGAVFSHALCDDCMKKYYPQGDDEEQPPADDSNEEK